MGWNVIACHFKPIWVQGFHNWVSCCIQSLVEPKVGIRAVIFVSVLTIVFDIWGFTIQKTAAIGFFVPFVSLVYLYFKRLQRAGVNWLLLSFFIFLQRHYWIEPEKSTGYGITTDGKDLLLTF
jgi:hypothetical protein